MGIFKMNISETPNVKNISAVILVGGKGTRLRSIVSDRPKILAEVCGRPFITFLFDKLISSGFTEVILCTGYMAKNVQDQLGNQYNSLKLNYSVEESPLGTGGALKNAEQNVLTDFVLVMNGDSYVDVDLSSFIKWYLLSDKQTAIVLAAVQDVSRFGKAIVDENNQIIAFHEKGDDLAPGYINAGIYLIPSIQIKKIPSNIVFSLEKEWFPSLVSEKNLIAYITDGAFIDIGTPETYLAASSFFLAMSNQ
jgi:NDP-sugar pyrophosphorylase family protein